MTLYNMYNNYCDVWLVINARNLRVSPTLSLLGHLQPDISFVYFHLTMVARQQNGTFVADDLATSEVLLC